MLKLYVYYFILLDKEKERKKESIHSHGTYEKLNAIKHPEEYLQLISSRKKTETPHQQPKDRRPTKMATLRPTSSASQSEDSSIDEKVCNTFVAKLAYLMLSKTASVDVLVEAIQYMMEVDVDNKYLRARILFSIKEYIFDTPLRNTTDVVVSQLLRPIVNSLITGNPAPAPGFNAVISQLLCCVECMPRVMNVRLFKYLLDMFLMPKIAQKTLNMLFRTIHIMLYVCSDADYLMLMPMYTNTLIFLDSCILANCAEAVLTCIIVKGFSPIYLPVQFRAINALMKRGAYKDMIRLPEMEHLHLPMYRIMLESAANEDLLRDATNKSETKALFEMVDELSDCTIEVFVGPSKVQTIQSYMTYMERSGYIQSLLEDALIKRTIRREKKRKRNAILMTPSPVAVAVAVSLLTTDDDAPPDPVLKKPFISTPTDDKQSLPPPNEEETTITSTTPHATTLATSIAKLPADIVTKNGRLHPIKIVLELQSTTHSKLFGLIHHFMIVQEFPASVALLTLQETIMLMKLATFLQAYKPLIEECDYRLAHFATSWQNVRTIINTLNARGKLTNAACKRVLLCDYGLITDVLLRQRVQSMFE